MSRLLNSTQGYSIRDEESLKKKYPSFNLYWEQKQKIKEKYPSSLFVYDSIGRAKPINYSKEERELFKQYMREIYDLIHEPDGHFQKFAWESLSDFDKLQMQRKANGDTRGKYKRKE